MSIDVNLPVVDDAVLMRVAEIVYKLTRKEFTFQVARNVSCATAADTRIKLATVPAAKFWVPVFCVVSADGLCQFYFKIGAAGSPTEITGGWIPQGGGTVPVLWPSWRLDATQVFEIWIRNDSGVTRNATGSMHAIEETIP